jgi:prevent-host-death family protein
MTKWQTDVARGRFTDLVEAADRHGPQVVMRGSEPVAVVLSPAEYRRLVRQADANFAHLIAQFPFGPDDVEPEGMNLSGTALSSTVLPTNRRANCVGALCLRIFVDRRSEDRGDVAIAAQDPHDFNGLPRHARPLGLPDRLGYAPCAAFWPVSEGLEEPVAQTKGGVDIAFFNIGNDLENVRNAAGETV